MHTETKEFLEEQARGLAEMAQKFRKDRVQQARQAARDSAARIKSLNGRVRALARSGVRVTNISHGAVEDLIELQAEIVNSALTEAAAQIERLANTGSLRDLSRDQMRVLQAARQRIVDDLSRALEILKDAGGKVRQVAAGGARKAGPRATKKSAPPKVKGKAKAKVKRKSAVRAKPRAAKARRKR
ncbi:MAG TPA: phasin family protein [Steroidobacteraceae bacterium]